MTPMSPGDTVVEFRILAKIGSLELLLRASSSLKTRRNVVAHIVPTRTIVYARSEEWSLTKRELP